MDPTLGHQTIQLLVPDNVRNPHHPPKRVVEGPRSTDEMGNLAIQLLPRNHDDLMALKEAQLRHVAGDPSNLNAWLAHDQLASLLESKGRLKEAIHHYRQALSIKPGDIKAHNNLGNALGSRLDEAILHYRRALRIQADYAEAHNSLGIALAGQAKLEEAIRHFRQALRIKPGYAEAQANPQSLRGSRQTLTLRCNPLGRRWATQAPTEPPASATGEDGAAPNLRGTPPSRSGLRGVGDEGLRGVGDGGSLG